jgi:hypothetical protein
MEKLLIGFALFISATSFAETGQCEYESYQKTIQDYPSGKCEELILNAAKDAGCTQSRVSNLKNAILSGNISKLSSGSSTFCKVETSRGHYQVMVDDMPEPPVATVYFSRND